MQFDGLVVFLLAVSLLSILVAYLAWRQRSKPSAVPLTTVSLGAGIWTSFYILEYISSSINAKLFWAVAKYPIVVFIPIALATFVLRYVGWEYWPGKKFLLGLSIVPIITLVIISTNSYHHLFFESYQLKQYQDYLGLEKTYGPWFWVQTIYTYFLLGGTAIQAITTIAPTGRVFRQQMFLLVIGLALPIVGDLLTTHVVYPWRGLDISPIAYSLSATFLFATTRFSGILNLVPLAHSELIEQLRDGLLVVNNQGIIMEVNSAAEKILEVSRQTLLGEQLSNLDHPALQILKRDSNGKTIKQEEQYGEPGSAHWYDVRVSAIFTDAGHVAGQIMIWHEVTDRKEVENQLRDASIRDQLTGLYNRLYFDESLERLSHSEQWPVAIIIVDLDNLKQTNDLYGHESGDQLLRRAAGFLQRTFRQDDIVARIGGDEFAIIVPNCKEMILRRLVMRIRGAITQPLGPKPVTKLEFSIGFAIANNGDEIHEAKLKADQQMYADKVNRKGI